MLIFSGFRSVQTLPNGDPQVQEIQGSHTLKAFFWFSKDRRVKEKGPVTHFVRVNKPSRCTMQNRRL